MQFADLAFGQGDDGDAGELQMLEQRGDIGLVAADAVERLGQHYIEHSALCVGKKFLDARAQDRAGTGYGRIKIALANSPAFTLAMFLAKPELVLDEASRWLSDE